jgi:Flp pilus assembly protein TadG
MLRSISRASRAVRTKWRRLGRDESGSVIAFLIVIPVLVGAVAIGVETGQLYRIKRQMQGAADAAALAGSVDRIAGQTNTVITADARYEARRNGFTDGVNTVSVTVNAPPASGTNINTPGAVEVIVTKSQAFSLGAVVSRWMGVTSNAFTMRARSVAAQGSATSYDGCIVALTTGAEQGISLTSFNNFTSDCAVASNGSAAPANSNASIYVGGSQGNPHATFKRIWTRGSFYSSGVTVSYNPSTNTPRTNQSSYIVDPYSGLAAPFAGSCSFTNYVEPTGSNLTLSAGTYCGGLTVVNKSNVYFTHGTYYIADGDLVLSANNNVSCSDCTGTDGVTFVLTTTMGNNANIGGVSITSQNNVALGAPTPTSSSTTYPYPGVLFYQDRNATVGTMTSTSKIFTLSSLNNATLTGAIYFPNNLINLSNLNNGNNANSGCTVWIGRYINFSSFNNNFVSGCTVTKQAGVVTPTPNKVFE